MLERLSAHLAARPGMRLLSQAGDLARPTVTTALLESGQAEPGQLFNTVSPALAFQYCPFSAQPADPASRVPAYTDNLNSWLGQILQVEIAESSEERSLTVCPCRGMRRSCRWRLWT